MRANPSMPGSVRCHSIYDAISDKRAASLGMVNGAHPHPASVYACGSPEVVPHVIYKARSRQKSDLLCSPVRVPPELVKTLAVAILINSIEVPGRLGDAGRHERPRRRMRGAINMIRQVQSPFELANIEPGPPT